MPTIISAIILVIVTARNVAKIILGTMHAWHLIGILHRY